MSKKIKYSFGIGVILICLVISGVYFYNNRLNESNLRQIEEKLIKEESFTTIGIIEDEDGKVVSSGGIKSYPYVLTAYTTNDFEGLSDEEKAKKISSLSKSIDEFTGTSSLIECGKNKYCSINEIILLGYDENREVITYSLPYTYNGWNDDNFSTEVTYTNNAGNFETKTIYSNNGNAKVTSASGNDKTLTISNNTAKIDGDYIYVTGTVQNNSSSPLSYIEIKVSYYNQDGEFLDTERTYVNSSDALLPEEQKSFEVMNQMVGEKYTNYKIEISDFQY